tara:strand:+ start:736 stop:1410 length:675 start_codon:yes stop_codon:yes gene_type:complete
MYFPSVHVENFFENPYRIINLAKSLSFKKEDNQNYPGVRSRPIDQINYELFQYICGKQLSYFYSRQEMESISYRCEMQFQLIPQGENAAFVHTDHGILTTIIYLTPDEEESGTSVVVPTDETGFFLPQQSTNTKDATDAKIKGINDPENTDINKTREASDKYNNTFKEVTRFNSIFNSLSMFNSSSFHQAHFNPSGGERLTLISFFHDISAPRFPVPEALRIRI